ncbi:MAG TPA: amidohydrolase family protein [Candidatus Limnocylindrales bacterium]|jgi:hypothetical protein
MVGREVIKTLEQRHHPVREWRPLDGSTLVPTEYVADQSAAERGPIWRPAVHIQARSLHYCLEAGVRVVSGTDAGCFPWREVDEAQEFEFEVRFGMAPAVAVQSATIAAAVLPGIANDYVRLAPGARADVVAVLGDSLEDVSALSRIDFVMEAGQVRRSPFETEDALDGQGNTHVLKTEAVR